MTNINFWWFGFWIYIGRYWFYFSIDRNWKPLFSERYGYRWYKKLGWIVIKFKKGRNND